MQSPISVQQNASLPISFNEAGKFIFTSFLQLKNALAPIVFMAA